MIRKTRVGLGIAVGMLSLSGCQRQEQQTPVAETTPEVPLPAAEQTPPVSIIRPEIVPEPVLDLPPEPIEVTIPFAEGGKELSDRAVARLQEILDSQQIAQEWPIVLRGHTDSAGSDQGNLAASEARAAAVSKWLTKHGIDKERIEIIALGEQNPIAPNARPDGTPNEEGRARNRRVTITIAPPEPAVDEP